jgi:hypothetical protein
MISKEGGTVISMFHMPLIVCEVIAPSKSEESASPESDNKLLARERFEGFMSVSAHALTNLSWLWSGVGVVAV